MGRTQATYRMRLQQVRDRLSKYHPGSKTKYKDLWEISHQLSAPSSAIPHSDTHAVATFCMLLEAIARLNDYSVQRYNS